MNKSFIHALAGLAGLFDSRLDLEDNILKELKEKDLLHYDMLEINSLISLKGLIAGDKAERRRTGIKDFEEFDTVYCLMLCSNWRGAINTMLHKWQVHQGMNMKKNFNNG